MVEKSDSFSRHGLRTSALGPLWVALCRLPKFGRLSLMLAFATEGGPLYSLAAREIMAERYGVRIGAYSYGPCFRPGVFPEGVEIGRYVSIATGVKVFLRNHPTRTISTHPFFFNSQLGKVERDVGGFGILWIGHDAWIGTNALILPGCQRIGIGAVIGAGAVVTRDVPDFAIVGGNPAKLIRFRFEDVIRQRVLASQWWEKSIEDCEPHREFMARSLEEEGALWHSFLSSPETRKTSGGMDS
jgi:virginiamycin A acetyltransferase